MSLLLFVSLADVFLSIKPENLFYRFSDSKNADIVVADFGCAIDETFDDDVMFGLTQLIINVWSSVHGNTPVVRISIRNSICLACVDIHNVLLEHGGQPARRTCKITAN